MLNYVDDVAIIGGGIAGISSAIELLDNKIPVSLFEASSQEQFGGVANLAFGGMLFVDSPVQRLNGIKDSPELAFSDWCESAEFNEKDQYAKQWANSYVNECLPEVYYWLKQQKISFLMMPFWAERGRFKPGNTVPRYHVTWGTGWGLVQTLIKSLVNHPNKKLLKLYFNHQVNEFIIEKNAVDGFHGETNINGSIRPFSVHASKIIVCAGGMGGNLEMVRHFWDTDRYGSPPEHLKKGVPPSVNGSILNKAMDKNISVINLNQMWNYPAGIAPPDPKYTNEGLSLIPPRSALWMNAYGRRVGPTPMVSGFDTDELCRRVGHLPGQYSWIIMNNKIAVRELQVSGSHVNSSIRDKSYLGVLKKLMLGDKKLLEYLLKSKDFIIANSLTELMDKMDHLSDGFKIIREGMRNDIEQWDAQINRGKSLHNDDQLRRIAQIRNWRTGRLRTCNYQKILDEKHYPLIAVRCFLMTRKTMGGIETNLHSQVLNNQGDIIEGLYAAGEVAGFGGGGISGHRSLEGTFLSCAIYNARKAAKHIYS